MMKMLMIFLGVVIITVVGFFAWQTLQKQTKPVVEPTPIPTVAPTPTPVPRTVSIIDPKVNATLVLGKTASVSGQATGLFEGTVVIQLVDSKGKMVVNQPIIAEDWMTSAPVDWATTIAVPASASAGQAQLIAINPSPKDASEDVSSTVTVQLSKTAAPPSTSSIEGNWKLSQLANTKGTLQAMPATISATMVLKDKTVSGKSACNNYNGSYTLSGTNQIAFGPMISTKMACPEPQMSLETAQLQSFEDATSYTSIGDVLTFLDAAKKPVAVYKKG